MPYLRRWSRKVDWPNILPTQLKAIFGGLAPTYAKTLTPPDPPPPYYLNTDRSAAVSTETFSYTVVAEAYFHWVEFRVYKVAYWDYSSVKGEGSKPFYVTNRATNLPDEPDLSGSVKWDWCSNWDLQPQGRMFHACDKALKVRL